MGVRRRSWVVGARVRSWVWWAFVVIGGWALDAIGWVVLVDAPRGSWKVPVGGRRRSWVVVVGPHGRWWWMALVTVRE